MANEQEIRSIGLFLRRLRKRRNFTVSTAGRESGLGHSLISRFESGDRQPRPNHIQALAKAYGVDQGVLLLSAGYLKLPGFDQLLEHPVSSDTIDDLLSGAEPEEKRELVRHLATIRLTRPMMEDLLPRND